MERFPQLVDRRDRVVEDQECLETRAVERSDRPAIDRVLRLDIVKLAAESRHRLTHDRVTQAQEDLVLLESKYPTPAEFLFDQGRLEHQLHLVES